MDLWRFQPHDATCRSKTSFIIIINIFSLAQQTRLCGFRANTFMCVCTHDMTKRLHQYSSAIIQLQSIHMVVSEIIAEQRNDRWVLMLRNRFSWKKNYKRMMREFLKVKNCEDARLWMHYKVDFYIFSVAIWIFFNTQYGLLLAFLTHSLFFRFVIAIFCYLFMA